MLLANKLPTYMLSKKSNYREGGTVLLTNYIYEDPNLEI